MSRLDMAFLGREQTIIVRDFKSIASSRRKHLTVEGVIAGGVVVGLFWLMVCLWWVL